MELRVLNYFLMAAREENITKAAQLLHVSQPTLSRQLMQLEEELGVKLFERSSHNIILTDSGMLLKRRAQEMISLADKTKQEFLHQEEELRGEIAIGSGEFHSMDCFSWFLYSFSEKYPLVRYNLYSGNADYIREQIENGILDFGLLIEPVDLRKYEFIHMAQKEKWGILVRKDSELAEKEYIRPEELIDKRLMISRSVLVQNELANWFGEYYEQLDIIASYNLLYNVAIMVRHKLGIALCIELDCSYEDLCFIPLLPQLETGSVMVWKKNQVLSPTGSAFIEFARKYLKEEKRP